MQRTRRRTGRQEPRPHRSTGRHLCRRHRPLQLELCPALPVGGDTSRPALPPVPATTCVKALTVRPCVEFLTGRYARAPYPTTTAAPVSRRLWTPQQLQGDSSLRSFGPVAIGHLRNMFSSNIWKWNQIWCLEMWSSVALLLNVWPAGMI
jgi:hypothetical protein